MWLRILKNQRLQGAFASLVVILATSFSTSFSDGVIGSWLSGSQAESSPASIESSVQQISQVTQVVGLDEKDVGEVLRSILRDEMQCTINYFQSAEAIAPQDSGQPLTARIFAITASKGFRVGERAIFGAMKEGGANYYASVWDWGDGTAQEAGRLVPHTYHKPGPHVLTLTVVDFAGNRVVASLSIDVGM